MDILQYFKNMAVYGPQKARRIALSEELSDFLLDWLMMQEQDLEEGVYIENDPLRKEQFVREYGRLANIDRETTDRLINQIGSEIVQNGQDAARKLINDKTINRKEKADREVIYKAYKSVDAIRQTNSNEIFDEDIASKILLGIPIAAAALSGVKKLFDKDRADFIAVNEANFIVTHEEYEEMASSGQATKTWITMNDNRVRDAHVAVDGQTVAISEPFMVSGYRMMYPGDNLTEPDIPADLYINCRCTLG